MVIFIEGIASPAQPPAFPARTCTSSGDVKGAYSIMLSAWGILWRAGKGITHDAVMHLSSYQCHTVLELASTICSSIRAQGPADGRTEKREERRASSGTVKHVRRG